MSLANDLLHKLHDVVQTLPSSLDLSDVVTSAQERIRELVDSTVAVVIVPDDTSDLWRVELAEGTRLAAHPPARRAPARADARARDQRRGPGERPGARYRRGLWRDEPQRAGHGTARPRPRRRTRLDRAQRCRMRTPRRTQASSPGWLSSLALAVDNARWFSRLRTLGAEAERARIARDLHDNVAQSLAYVGFELDRLATAQSDPQLRELQQVVRGVVADLRETLYQLRATVSENQDLVEVARDYITRWSSRTGVETEFVASHRRAAGSAPGGAGTVADPAGIPHERGTACRCLSCVDHLEDW